MRFAPEHLEPKLTGKSYAQMTQVEDPEEYVLGYCLAEVYSLVKGIKEFGKNGLSSAIKEMSQLHNRIC